MIKEAILITGGVAVHKAGQLIKKTGEMIDDMQKERFRKVVEQSKNEDLEQARLWVEEEVIKKKKLLEEKIYHQYSFYDMEDRLVYRAAGIVIREKRKAEIHNGNREKIAFIEETGDSFSEGKRYREYSIFAGGARIDIAKQDYEGDEPVIRLSHKNWSVQFEKNEVSRITDGEGLLLLEVEKKIGNRRLLNLYTEEEENCVLLFLTGTLNGLQQK